MKIGYARVSNLDQNPRMQEDLLKDAGCEKIYVEKGSGRKKDRPTFRQMLESLRAGDTLVVYSLSRMCRSTKDAIEIANDLIARNINLKVLNRDIDTTSPLGKFFFTVTAAIDELEADTIRERTQEGLKAAKSRGIKLGRPGGLSDEAKSKAEIAASLYREGKMPVGKIAKNLGIGVKTLYRYLHFEGVEINRMPKED